MNKLYNNVSDLIEGSVDKDFKKKFDESIRNRSLSTHLLALRCKNGITQKEMAHRIKCNQSKISKIENALDENLQVKDLIDYATALNLQLTISFLEKSRTSADSIKYHALKIKEHLDRLADLSEDDEKIHKGISGFFGEYFFNMINMFQESFNKLNRQTSFNEEPIHISQSVDTNSLITV
ncbi:MAG: transcriptional regulator, XRE family [uncultured bacterium]|nr:MAG: transcriptional regulator, XRE family [uncultured bacterium]